MSKTEQLPSDIDACHKLIRERLAIEHEQDSINQGLARENQILKFEIEQLKRYIYRRRSELHTEDDSQLPLFEQQPVVVPQSEPDEEGVTEEISYTRRKRSKADRFPATLPREVTTKDVFETERSCPCCNVEMPIIDTDVRERLEFVSAKLVVHQTRYLKRACGKCKQGISVGRPPSADENGATLTPGSRYGFGVTAQIILGKYADHLPLYRLEDVFARAGVVIPRSTQVGLLDAAADLLSPLTDLMKSRLIASGVIGMDDTPVQLQDLSLPGKMKTARMWLARGLDESPYNVFFFHESRERNGPAKFLGDFKGWVTVDAYGVNDGVYLGSGDRILASCCHAHVRRKFEAAKGNDPSRAARALSFYRRLFDIEDRASELSAEDRLALRRCESLPLLNEFKNWLDEQRADTRVLPKSAIGAAVRYAINQWKPLVAMLTDGRLPIHNNDVERDLRRLTIGRKNWLFFGSASAGEVASRMYTLVASAMRHNLDAWAYLDDVLRRLAGGEVAVESLLPDHWAKSHPESIHTYQEAESLARADQTKARRARRRVLTKR